MEYKKELEKIKSLFETHGNSDHVSDDDFDENGDTPLHRASAAGNKALVVELVLTGSPLDAKNSKGRTSLMEAILHYRVMIVVKLIAAGCNLNVIDMFSAKTALHYAAFGGDTEIIGLLLDAKADNMNINFCYPLDCAFENQNISETQKLDTISFMLERNCPSRRHQELLNFLIQCKEDNPLLRALRFFCKISNLSSDERVQAEEHLTKITDSINNKKSLIMQEQTTFPIDLINVILGYEDEGYEPPTGRMSL